jgi:aspartyl-tRNA(Asn)/glutamyl-tRNA(Gln) amidotransferase subunit C
MALSLDEVKRIAALAKLRLTPREEVLYATQLGRIVDYVDQIRALEGVESDHAAAAAAAAGEGDGVADSRPDEVVDGLSRELALANAPDQDGEFVVVPQVQRGSPRSGAR